jgi:hypothetical protein
MGDFIGVNLKNNMVYYFYLGIVLKRLICKKMSKKIFLISVVAAISLGSVTFLVIDRLGTNNASVITPVSTSTVPVKKTGTDPKNISYSVEGKTIELANGRSEQAVIPGSASKIITATFGEPIFGDLNGDAATDTAIMLTQETGGSGTFFYVVAAVNKNGSYEGMNAVLLGDRVAPQNIEIRDGVLIANYAERKTGEPFTAQPSVGVSKYLEVKNGVLVERTQTTGTLSGDVTVGPICPVERVGIPCVVPSEAYTSREVIIFAKDGKTEIARKHFDSTGHYEFDLKAGSYVVNIPKQGIGGGKGLPGKVVVVAGKITIFNFSIDTGIR